MSARRCDPRLWQHFRREKTPKTPRCRELILNLSNVASLTVPAPCTPRDVVEQIARQARIPIESLSDDLNQPALPRAITIFGFSGDCLDGIADNYDNMQWWISDNGLNMAIVIPEAAQLSEFNKLAGGLAISKEEDGKLSKSAVLEIAKAIDEAGYTLEKELQPAQWKPIAEYNRKYSRRAIKTYEQAAKNSQFVRCVRRRLYAARDKYRKAFAAI
jgi:hypothetical protein